MARIFQVASRICVGLAIAMLVIAVVRPIGASWLLNFGLSLLVVAFAASLGNHYFLRSPIPVRGGALITIDASPIGYRVWYLVALSFCGFLLYILLHSPV